MIIRCFDTPLTNNTNYNYNYHNYNNYCCCLSRRHTMLEIWLGGAKREGNGKEGGKGGEGLSVYWCFFLVSSFIIVEFSI